MCIAWNPEVLPQNDFQLNETLKYIFTQIYPTPDPNNSN